MKILRLACLAVAIAVLAPGVARAQVPWPGPGTQHLPPDPTIPYLPGVAGIRCPEGSASCFRALESDLVGCTGDGLIVRAAGVRINLNGFGDGGTKAPGSVGIRNAGYDDVRVDGGEKYARTLDSVIIPRPPRWRAAGPCAPCR